MPLRIKMKKTKYSIFTKLIIIISVLLISVSFFTTNKVVQYFEGVSIIREQEVNLKNSKQLATTTDRILQGIIDKAKFYSTIIVQGTTYKNKQQILNALENDSDILSIKIYKRGTKTAIKEITKASFLKRTKMTNEVLSSVLLSKELQLNEIIQGNVQIQPLLIKKETPVIFVGFPILRNKFQEVEYYATLLIRQELIQQFYRTTDNYVVYLLDEFGNVLGHKSEGLVISGKSSLPDNQFQKIKVSTVKSKQMYIEQENKRTLTSFTKTKHGPIVFSQIEEAKYMAPIEYIKKQSFYILLVTLSLMITLISIFSNSLTKPIETLLSFTKEIAKGNFDLGIAKIVTSNDEVGGLALAFDEMTVGLKEREKIKTVINKFHGESVADDLIKGNVELKGNRKFVTVFFSDIRAFTKFSESRTAEEVVSMLNEYMDVMVKCIYKHNGIVDKFVGDAIMAVWGVPDQTEEDTKNALNACLEMRVELEKLNERRISRSEEPLMIGMGLHCGEVISGTVGSEDRMEYTVIGDTVNTSARIEASTKSFGTDLLVSGALKKKVESGYIFTDAGKVMAKGKTEALELFKVEGIRTKDGDQIIKTDYSHFEPEEDKGGKTQRVEC
jgi:adenylate cyclase